MERFTCTCETQPELFFDSTACLVCGRLTGYCDDMRAVTAFNSTEVQGEYLCTSDGARYRQCDNYINHAACNGMVKLGDQTTGSSSLCFACHFNKTIPNLSVPEHLPLWQKMESAKRRALYTLAKLGLELPDKQQDPVLGLSFEFITDRDAADHFSSSLPNCDPVYTGHDNGDITINLAEADDVARASTKLGLAENYRTLLGHFRHELGHYYWDRLVFPNQSNLQEYRKLFGDETQSYEAALDRHYTSGPPANWQNTYISAYATMHPWEDWAETWAHYIHMIDTLETAKAFGFELNHPEPPSQATTTTQNLEELSLPQQASLSSANDDGVQTSSVEMLLDTWMQLSVALNALNRSMGLEDAYPFVLTPEIRNKLMLVHHVIHSTDQGAGTGMS